jgi:homoserine O-acetyltransferase/O-succinyltransferase
VINAAQDQLVNPNAALEFAKTIHAGTTVLQSDCGHFALRCELATIRAAVETALKSGRQDGSTPTPRP